MVDSKEPQNNRPEEEERISELYQASRDEQSVEVPKALDDQILAQAKQAVCEEGDAGNAEQADDKKVIPIRRRWELPLSIAASFVLVTLLYINNKDDIPAVLDTGVPQVDYDTLNRPAPATAPTESLMGAAEVEMDQMLEEVIVTSESRAESEMPAQNKADARAALKKAQPARERRATVEGYAKPKQPESVPSIQKREPRLRDETRMKLRKESTGFMSAPAEMPRALKAEQGRVLDDAVMDEQEAQPLDAEAWLGQISELWQQGGQKQAKAQLAEFRAHFPDYSLEAYCKGYEGLCEME